MATKIVENNVNLLDVDSAIAVMARSGAAYAKCGAGLRAESLARYGTRAEALVWAAVVALYEGSGHPPQVVELQAEIQRCVGQSAEEVNEASLEKMRRMVRWMFDESKFPKAYVNSVKTHARVSDAVRAWELKATQADLARVYGSQDTDAARFAEGLEAGIRKMGQAAAIGRSQFPSLFEGGLAVEAEASITQETGCDIVDFFTDGLAPGEILLLVAPMGSCKTTITIQLAAAAAKRAKLAHRRLVRRLESQGKPADQAQRRVVVLFSSEEPRKNYNLRFLCHVAKIPLARLKKVGLAGLDTGSVPAATEETQYESQVFPSGTGFRCERDRAQAAMSMLDEFVWFFDVTGTTLEDGSEAPGSGGIKEYAALLETRLRQNPGVKPGMVLVDHLSASTLLFMKARPLNSRENPEAVKREFMKSFAKELRDRILSRYGVSALMTHQITGRMADRPPTTILSHTDAADCTGVAEYVDVAIACGNFTKGEQAPYYTMFNASKVRNRERRSPQVAALHGLFGEVSHAREIVVDNNTFAATGDSGFGPERGQGEFDDPHAGLNNLSSF